MGNSGHAPIADGGFNRKTLVVLLHGWGAGPDSMGDVRALIQSVYGPDVAIHAPALAYARRYRSVRAVHVVRDALHSIDRYVEREGPFARVILMGHSLGATIVRRIHLVASGRCHTGFRPEPEFEGFKTRPWAALVERIILIAAFNRGWAISDRLSWRYSILFNIAGLLGHVIPGWAPTIFDIRLGAPFIVQTRLHWMAYRRHQATEVSPLHDRPILVQIIGTRDDMVSPFDQVDISVDGAVRSMVVGSAGSNLPHAGNRDFFLVEMPETDHRQTIQLQGTEGATRRRIMRDALLMDRTQLAGIAIEPALLADEVQDIDEDVQDTVFVIHGIRDDGFWTHRVAERIRSAGPKVLASGMPTFRGLTPSYGYFAILPFLLPWVRRVKVEWFMDQYVTALALYPNSRFHFVGHSNGTYLAARSLRDYPALHFENVLFAGSVVRRDFPWKGIVDAGRVLRLQNIVASDDRVVAWFPKSVEWIRAFDLGGAGVDGFKDAGLRPHIADFKYVRGGHGAGIAENHWKAIARFIVEGVPFASKLGDPHRSDPFVAAVAKTRLCLPALAILFGAILPTAILLYAWPYSLVFELDGWRSFGLLTYGIALRFAVTRF